MKRFIALALILVMCAALMPVTAQAVIEEIGTHSYTFTTFEELQDLASKTYSETIIVNYIGEGPLVIKDDMTVPEKLILVCLGEQLEVPAGVTLTVEGTISWKDMTVEGILDLQDGGYLDFTSLEGGQLDITGSLKCGGVLQIDDTATITGKDKIEFTMGYAEVQCYYSVTDTNTLKAAVAKANASPDPRWKHHIDAMENAFSITESIVFPSNCQFYIGQPITVEKGCTLENNGDIVVTDVMTVSGTIINNGFVIILPDSDGKLVIDDGMYQGSGLLEVQSQILETPDTAFSGLDLSDFAVDTFTNEWGSNIWRFQKTAHAHSYTAVKEVAPTCVDEGYTVYTCTCGDSYQDNYKAATGVHTYADDADTTCEVCGYVRTINSDDTGKTKTTPMYRMYNPNSGEHFYTGSTEERDNLKKAGWTYEGVAWNAPTKGGDPVYRCYNPNSGDHHYTTDASEKDMLVELGWKYEGVAWNSASGDNIPLYRLWNPNADLGSHHYTSSTEERDYLVELGWVLEGIGWYGLLK